MPGKTVAIVGAGALGSPMAYGVTTLERVESVRIIDGDRVEISNLPRQPWYTQDDVGQFKSVMLSHACQTRGVPCGAVDQYLTDDNAADLLCGVDVILDATDNWPARMAMERYARAHQLPWIFASAVRLDGQVAWMPPEGPCLQCLFGESLQTGPACFEAGVLGMVTLAVAGQAISVLEEWLAGGQLPRTLRLIEGAHDQVMTVRLSGKGCGHYRADE